MKKLASLLGVLVMTSCGFPPPPIIGPDDAGSDAAGSDAADSDDGGPDTLPDDTACQLTAASPALANTDDTITIEGKFADGVMVNFPGGTSVAATMLGPHRARVQVPASATAGALTITTCGMTIGSQPFRRASFTLGLGAFATNYDQADVARQYPTLAMQRDSHTTVTVGSHLYVLGGVARTGSLSSIEHSLINADGTLGRFTLAAPTLAIPRRAHTTVAIQNHLYVLGGFNDGSLSSIERATISSDGALGPFTTIHGIEFETPRQGHTATIVGNYVYVVGGLDTGTLNSVERTAIHGDASLGPFKILPGIKLVTGRRGHTAIVAGNYLYVLGGSGDAGALRDVERAAINEDGSLGAFEITPNSALMNARSGHSAQVIGSKLYVFGGVGGSGALRTVEQSTIGPDGSLTPFEIIPNAAMTRSRRNHTTTVVGNYLYILGGTDDNNRIDRGEHATINASGSLSSFAIIPDISLTTERAHGPAVVLGNYFYMIGGGRGATTVERTNVNADGSIGVFSPVAGLTLTNPRDGHTAAVIGNYVYIIGNSLNIERAAIGSDGALGPFETVPAALTISRVFPSAVIMGEYIYVLGGSDVVPDLRVERSLINADGTLAAFSTIPGSDVSARSQMKIQTIRGYVYLIAGRDVSTGARLPSPERALLGGAGVLEAFEPVPDVVMGTESPSIVLIGDYLFSLGISGKLERARVNAGLSAARPLESFSPVTDVNVTSHSAAGTAVTGNYFHVVGGTSGRVYQTTVGRAELR